MPNGCCGCSRRPRVGARDLIYISGASRGIRVGPVAQWLEPTAHNGLVGGSSPPGPTTHSFEPRDFPDTCKWAAIGGLRRWRFVSAETNFTRSGISGELSLWPAFAVPGGRIGK